MERPSSWEEAFRDFTSMTHFYFFIFCFVTCREAGWFGGVRVFSEEGTFHIFIFYFFIFQPVERPCVLEASGFFGGSLKPSCGIT